MAKAARRLTITPIHPYVGARVKGVDLAQPLDEAMFQAICEAFQEYSVLVFHDQWLTDEQQMAFSKRFGPLETTIKATGRENRLHPNLVDLSNLDPEHGSNLLDWTDRRMVYQSGNQLWHSDSSFKAGPPDPPAHQPGEWPEVDLRWLPCLVRRRDALRGVPPTPGRATGAYHASGVRLRATAAAVGSRHVGQPLRLTSRPPLGRLSVWARKVSRLGRNRRAAAGPGAGRLELTGEAKERRLIAEAPGEVSPYGQALAVPE